MAKDVTFQIGYTFSKRWDRDSIYNSSAIPGEIRASQLWAASPMTDAHSAVQYTYTFPKPIRGNNLALNNFATRTIFQRWQVSGITPCGRARPTAWATAC